MLMFWRIRYLDSRDRCFKDRDLWLDTDTLDPVVKAAVEFAHDTKESNRGREILRYRHLFHESNLTNEQMREPFAQGKHEQAFLSFWLLLLRG